MIKMQGIRVQAVLTYDIYEQVVQYEKSHNNVKNTSDAVKKLLRVALKDESAYKERCLAYEQGMENLGFKLGEQIANLKKENKELKERLENAGIVDSRNDNRRDSRVNSMGVVQLEEGASKNQTDKCKRKPKKKNTKNGEGAGEGETEVGNPIKDESPARVYP